MHNYLILATTTAPLIHPQHLQLYAIPASDLKAFKPKFIPTKLKLHASEKL
jgi:hypothetical protein